jgi:parvulin-like peptidyl-prolyl isomerase
MLRAGEAHARASAGEDFGTLVREYSSAPDNSDLGWFTRGELIPDLERTLFSLKTGEISNPVPSGMGIHLLKKTGEEEPRQMPFEEVSRNIMRALEMRNQTKAVSDYVEELIRAADIKFVDAALDFTKTAESADTLKSEQADTSAAVSDSAG